MAEYLKYENLSGSYAISVNEGNIDGLPVLIADKVSTTSKNDYFSIYAYGNYFKVVYHKVGKLALPERKKYISTTTETKSEEERFRSSLSRSKSAVFEIACCNEFTYFCTFTQDQKMRDRFDLSSFRKDFTMLIRNLNRSRSEENKIKYLLIPEKHKKGGWHMHGLFMGLEDSDLRPFSLSENIPLRIKKQIRDGEIVYDWTKYRQKFGYFTCTKIKDNIAVSKYITKYLTKEFSASVRNSGQHLYFASQGLKRREALVVNSFDKCPFTEFDFENDFIKIKTFTVDDLEVEKLSLLF